MKTFLCVSACALAVAGMLSVATPVYAGESGAFGYEQPATPIDIGRIKSVLRLTAEQERYWPPVEAALRGISRRQTQDDQAGFVRRVSRRVVSVVLDGAAIHRLAVAARPLIAVLSDEQKEAASGLAQEMGLGPVVAALR
ncbi:MAG TPA: hypothetical protein VHT93_04170 [Pseudolabrys sp.]|jgi:hypothetical protein|nr:hypothetical protein [Pseudolabrys sp.]